MIEIKNLSENRIKKIKRACFDRIIEKHEGPARWEVILEFHDPEFIEIDGKPVLLPVSQEQHQNITILRVIPSQDEQVLTIFLKDTTYLYEPEYEKFEAGFVAICEKISGEAFYSAILYHEWFIIKEHLAGA